MSAHRGLAGARIERERRSMLGRRIEKTFSHHRTTEEQQLYRMRTSQRVSFENRAVTSVHWTGQQIS
ncbi:MULTISPECIES: hypothetical protein [unclassified Bradyrhizobium]|uniref:hypothetical protein n=1 Tax=unclassified Bradyrhizobium TaxID=2631580 RepID=UPI0020B1F3E7|nr:MULTISPECIES: hypothetical protein [unclassified Bradyrhizobium]MCP3398900.1 hypothetical protein [Bradyrhizobium sp. CCGB20]MCP3407502.1 hypothetical protein [Bradyrhizobium sp. CCGB01]